MATVRCGDPKPRAGGSGPFDGYGPASSCPTTICTRVSSPHKKPPVRGPIDLSAHRSVFCRKRSMRPLMIMNGGRKTDHGRRKSIQRLLDHPVRFPMRARSLSGAVRPSKSTGHRDLFQPHNARNRSRPGFLKLRKRLRAVRKSTRSPGRKKAWEPGPPASFAAACGGGKA